MAEIKSTIDLIMERTKNLSASREERESWHRQEREKHIRGLIQRLLDDGLTLDDVKEELDRERKKGQPGEVRVLVGQALAGHVDPETDNERLFRIVCELAGTPEKRLQDVLRACQAEFFARKTALVERQRGELESAGISGSAVLPNAEADPQWAARRDEMQASCSKRIAELINS